jgi:hypothetical protein
MKRKLAVWALLAAAGGWAGQAAQAGKYMSQAWNAAPDGVGCGARCAGEVPGVVGPWGQPVAQRVPEGLGQPTGADYAHAALLQQYPREVLSQVGITPHPGVVTNAAYAGGAPGSGVVQTAGGGPGPGPGPNPMVAGVPGIVPPGPPGAVAAVGALTGQPSPYGVSRTEVRFVGPGGMKISWYAPRPDGTPGFATQYLEAPARYNFLQASVYRLKLSDIPNRPGIDLYPTLEVVPCNLKTATFLAHSAVPISFTEEDFEQVAAGNFVVKVIYLPDPQFQDLAATGPDEVVSSRLEPGVDPILEAKRRGTILAIVRLGNIDLEAPNTPAMDAPDPKALHAMQAARQQQMLAYQQQMMMMRAGMMPPNLAGMMGAGMMPPPGMMPPGMMPPGMVPPGMMPPGAAPGGPGVAGATRPGIVPPGVMMPGTAAPSIMRPGTPAAGTPSGMAPGAPGAPAATAPAASPVGKATTDSPGLPFAGLFGSR